MIGILDSGVGGLSVLREIQTLLPSLSVIYIGDNAWCPYGNKSFPAIRNRTFALTDFLLEQGVELIVIACNSATIVAIQALRTQYLIPFIGMEPGVKPAAALTQTNTIGVLATEASLKGEKFHHLVAQHAGDLRVITQPCPKFVELVEAGILDGPEVDRAIDEYTATMFAHHADVLILGCTHYPFLRPALEARLPPNLHLIDTGPAIARRVAEHHPTLDPRPTTTIFTTGDSTHFEKLTRILTPQINATFHSLNLP